MKSTKLSLSLQGFSRVAELDDRQDFYFHVREHQYRTHKALACFISPKIYELLKTDQTLDVFTIDHPDSNFEFQEIIDVISGSELEISSDNADYLVFISMVLGNDELLEIAQKYQIRKVELNPINVMVNLIRKHECNFHINDEIRYIASHITEIKEEKLKDLDFDLLYRIMSHPLIQVSSESWFFNFILRVVRRRGSEFRPLLALVHYEYLDEADIKKFLLKATFEDISGELWNSLKKRLAMKVTQPDPTDRAKPQIKHAENSHVCQLENGQTLNGIIKYLTNECGGNVDEKNVVKITASGVSENSPNRVANLEWTNAFYTTNLENSWIQFDFLDATVTIDQYTIKTDKYKKRWLKSWVLEGSNDGKVFNVIDTRDDNTDLSSDHPTQTFRCNKDGTYKIIRLRQTGPDSLGDHYLVLQNIEFFGSYNPIK